MKTVIATVLLLLSAFMAKPLFSQDAGSFEERLLYFQYSMLKDIAPEDGGGL